MQVHSATFLCSAVSPEQYPPEDLPEVAFAGRSNVGKSSLLNKLLNRKKLVRTSKTPGCTQLLNFFDINERWRFVDLPGYGYAKVPAAVKRRWRPMVETYLTSRSTMRGIVLLLDVRRTPSPEDLTFWDWLKARGMPVVAVLTKVDKLSRNQRKKQAAGIAAALDCEPKALLQFSAATGEGREALWRALKPLLGVTGRGSRDEARGTGSEGTRKLLNAECGTGNAE
jgi:GTP-binding protein